MEFVLRDQSVWHLYVEDSLVRQSSHGLLRALVTQLEDMFEHPLKRARLPDNVRVSPYEDTAFHLGKDEAGNAMVNNTDEGSSIPVFPSDWSLTNHLILSHTIDRGSSGGTVLSFMLAQGYLWTVFWGWCHDLWNSVKTAGTKILLVE